MIHVEKDQIVPENKNLKVATATGDYDDNALIEVYDILNPEVVAGAFQAQYIVYGGLVYRFNSAKELGEEILKIDPQSTHTSASYVRMSNELLVKMDAGSLEVDSLDEVISTEQSKTDDQRIEKEVVDEETVDDIEVIPENNSTDESTGEIQEETPVEDVIDFDGENNSVPPEETSETPTPPSDIPEINEVVSMTFKKDSKIRKLS